MAQQWVKVPGEKPYYWNLETQATSWTEPQGVDVVWVVQETATGGVYYWNRATDETSWEPPARAASRPLAEQRGQKEESRRWPQQGAAVLHGSSDEENNPQHANAGPRRTKAGEGTRLKWKAQQTPEGLVFRTQAEVSSGLPELGLAGRPEPLATWPLMESRVSAVAAESVAAVKVEPSPMMIVHALKQTEPLGHMVGFADGRMMMKLPSCFGGATMVPMAGSAAALKARAKGKMVGETVEAADHLTSRFGVKGDAGPSPDGGSALASSRMWDINKLQELNCRYVDPSGHRKHLPMNLSSLQIEAINTMDAASASFMPSLADCMPYSSCIEHIGSYEYSSIQAAACRLRIMRCQGLVAASMKVAARVLSYSWTPGTLESDWTPYLRPKTLVPIKERGGGRPEAGAAPLQWWQQAAAAQGQPGLPAPGGWGAPEAPAAEGGFMADAMSQATLLQSIRNTVLDILGTDTIEDDTSLMHAGVTAIKPVPLSSSLQAIFEEGLSTYPQHRHDLATGFEPPPPTAEGALAKPGERPPGEPEKGCRATATRIRSSASSFYTLMGSTAADYTTMALNVPQGGLGRGPGLSATPFTAALNP
mmetsp:Transcript_47330/g.151087  ORF Transcript_47330/g.151087 Transcript_47330/m.151087 type:complete len:593 (-) Transcript_47330:153-1931(-)